MKYMNHPLLGVSPFIPSDPLSALARSLDQWQAHPPNIKNTH